MLLNVDSLARSHKQSFTSNKSVAIFERPQENTSQERALQSDVPTLSENVTAIRSVLTGRFSHDESQTNITAKAKYADPVPQPQAKPERAS